MSTVIPVQGQRIEGLTLYLLLVAIALAAFLISLDGFIVNVAIPTISGELGVRSDIGTWVITLFTMSTTLFVPLSGRLSTRFGNVPIFLFGILIFSISSLLCGLCESFSLLLVFRIIQGAGAGLILPVSLTLIINNFPEEKRSVAVGFWSFFVMVGPAMGPMIGGFLSNTHWHWMFLVNLPVAVFSFFTVYFLLGNQKEERRSEPFDWRGMTLLFVCVATLQVALNRGQLHDWFRSSLIVTLFIIALISGILFLIWEIFYHDPFIDLSHFTHRNFALASVMMGTGMSILFTGFVLEALWLQEALGYTPGWVGLTLAPLGILPLIFYPIMGKIVNLIDVRIWLICSFLLYAFTFFGSAISMWMYHFGIWSSLDSFKE